MSDSLKLYVWEGGQHSSALVCILAHSESQAWELMCKKYPFSSGILKNVILKEITRPEAFFIFGVN